MYTQRVYTQTGGQTMDLIDLMLLIYAVAGILCWAYFVFKD